MTGRLVRVNGVELWTSGIGDPGSPAILLVNGASGQSIWWRDEFCAKLVHQSHDRPPEPLLTSRVLRRRRGERRSSSRSGAPP